MHRYLRGRIRDYQDDWAQGSFLNQEQFATAIANARAIGNCDAFAEMIDLDVQRLEGVFDDD